jgi:hypothetical protein
MIKVHNLDGVRKMFIGNAPDPFCPISGKNDFPRLCYAATDSLGVAAIAKLLGFLNRSDI